jgi:hypothetical protein
MCRQGADIGLTKARATDAGMKLLPELLSSRFRVDAHEGKRSIVILNEDGVTPMLCENPDGSKRAGKFGDILAEATQKYPSMFEVTGAGGGGKQPGGRGGVTPTDKTLNRAEWDALNPYAQARKMH